MHGEGRGILNLIFMGAMSKLGLPRPQNTGSHKRRGAGNR